MRLVKNEDQFQSLGVRHDHVGDDEIDGRFLKPLKRVFAIGGFYHGMTFVLQSAAEGQTHAVVVVNEEYSGSIHG